MHRARCGHAVCELPRLPGGPYGLDPCTTHLQNTSNMQTECKGSQDEAKCKTVEQTTIWVTWQGQKDIQPSSRPQIPVLQTSVLNTDCAQPVVQHRAPAVSFPQQLVPGVHILGAAGELRRVAAASQRIMEDLWVLQGLSSDGA